MRLADHFGASRVTRKCVRIAKRIIEAAKTGELDPIRLYSQAILGFGIDDVSMPSVGVDRNPPIPVYALIACTA